MAVDNVSLQHLGQWWREISLRPRANLSSGLTQVSLMLVELQVLFQKIFYREVFSSYERLIV